MENLTFKKNNSKKIFFAFLTAFLAAIFYLYYILKSEVPTMDGKIKLLGLKEKVTVYRDAYGVPHIYAKNTHDLFFTLGHVMASERLFQMEMMRRMANGELSEVVGEKMLKSDKLFRTLGLKVQANRILYSKYRDGKFDPKFIEITEAFFGGVNSFVDSGNLPIDFRILNIPPRHFSMSDSYALMGLMSFSFGTALTHDPLMEKIKARYTPSEFNELRNDPLKSDEVKIEKRFVDFKKNDFFFSRMNEIISDLENGFTLFEGSNGWLISKEKSQSGYPILANDPHISTSHPGVWFEAHLNSPDYEMYGHFLPTIPFPILGHNRKFGWGFTMSLVDDMDIYREKLNLKNKTYLHKGKNLNYVERLEEIKIKNKKTERILVLETHHGPILDEIFDQQDLKSLSLKWTFLKDDNEPLSILYDMGKAQSIEEFKTAISKGVSPGLNVLYADKSNIAWWMFGDVPLRNSKTISDQVLDGVSGENEYLGYLSFNKKPSVVNPKEGYIVSANSRPVNFLETERGDFHTDDRYKTIEELLKRKEKWGVEETKELQTLSLNIYNRSLLTSMLNSLKFENSFQANGLKEYVKILSDWNLESDKNSIAAALYYTWCMEITKILLKDLSDEEFKNYSKLANHWAFFKRVILNQDSAFFKKFDRSKTITSALVKTVEYLKSELGDDYRNWKWGHLHTIEFVHPIGRIKPLNFIFNLGPYESSGAFAEINNQKYAGYTDGFKVKAGPSTRRIIDFKTPEKSFGILPIGESGHILSPFYKDQVELYLGGKYRLQLLDKSEIKKQKQYEAEYVP